MSKVIVMYLTFWEKREVVIKTFRLKICPCLLLQAILSLFPFWLSPSSGECLPVSQTGQSFICLYLCHFLCSLSGAPQSCHLCFPRINTLHQMKKCPLMLLMLCPVVDANLIWEALFESPRLNQTPLLFASMLPLTLY